MKKLLLLAILRPAVGCADITPTQQRALTGTAAGAGLLGGLLVDQPCQAQDRAFQQGYVAGRRRG